MKKIISLFVCLVCLLSLPISVGQAPPPPAEAAVAMDRALQLLKDSNWQQADQAFDLVLMFAPNYAPAHMGKLCAALRVTEERLLGELTPPVSIDDHPLFRAALEHAPPAYRAQIQEYANTLNARIRAMHDAVEANIQEDDRTAGDRMVLTINAIEYAFRWCPPGTFIMGSPPDEPGRMPDESQHRVGLSRGFWMLETEVTQGMWASVMGNNPSQHRGIRLPVDSVLWHDAQAYIQALNNLGVAPAGFRFSLPTEAQWEYACRAGTTTAFHFGNTLDQNLANTGGRQPREVGSYPANAWGLHDMHGNVWEWVLDMRGAYPSGAVTDPTGASTGGRVLRGGSWAHGGMPGRSAFRHDGSHTVRCRVTGFRLALVPTTASESAPSLRELLLQEYLATESPDEVQVQEEGQPTLATGETVAPPPPPAAAAAMDRALQALKDSNWQQADQAFNNVLMIAPQYAPAHLGRLLAQLHVTEERLLGDRVPPISIDENPHFRAALEHADPAYRRQILGYAVTLNRRFEEMRHIQPSEHAAGERRVLTINSVEYAFRFCPPGTFAMGSPHNEANRQPNETQHQVTLTRGFWMLETEVTQLMWLSVMGNNPSRFQGANHPVEQVSWNEAQEYIEKLNDLGVAPGFRFSLPTEAQWEYACRAGTITAYHFGNSLRPPPAADTRGGARMPRGGIPPSEWANFSGQRTREVGSYPANAWGLHDMHGNVAEWVLDFLGEYPVGAVIDPAGTATGSNRVVRGGGWNNDAQDCRSARRDRLGPSRQNSSTGLRLVLILTDESAAAQTLSDGTLALRESPAIVPPGAVQAAVQPTGHITVESAGGSAGTVQPMGLQQQSPQGGQQGGQVQHDAVPSEYAWHWDPRLQQWVLVQQPRTLQPTPQPNPGRLLDDRPALQGILRYGLGRLPF